MVFLDRNLETELILANLTDVVMIWVVYFPIKGFELPGFCTAYWRGFVLSRSIFLLWSDISSKILRLLEVIFLRIYVLKLLDFCTGSLRRLCLMTLAFGCGPTLLQWVFLQKKRVLSFSKIAEFILFWQLDLQFTSLCNAVTGKLNSIKLLILFCIYQFFLWFFCDKILEIELFLVFRSYLSIWTLFLTPGSSTDLNFV